MMEGATRRGKASLHNSRIGGSFTPLSYKYLYSVHLIIGTYGRWFEWQNVIGEWCGISPVSIKKFTAS